MERLIPVVNRLQDVFHSVGLSSSTALDLPRIAVVGSQSAGKSSVLESLVGRDFLPRGTGIVTRRPLVLQLIHHTDEAAGNNSSKSKKSSKHSQSQRGDEWGEFLHAPGKKFENFSQIRSEIEAETNRICSGKAVSDEAIHLKIYSPHVLNITLIDLPGITKVPIGNQPGDIETQVREIILEYVRPANTLVLAVTAANTDVANSDALKLAMEVDPQGHRTLAVLTKLDLMDAGTDCKDVLSGAIIPLRLGFVGVVGRSQADIEKKVPISHALEKEAAFFRSHPSYRSACNKLGTPYLARRLSSILMEHIRDCLPDLRNRLQNFIARTQKSLHRLGNPLPNNPVEKGQYLLQEVNNCATQFNALVFGTDLTQRSSTFSSGVSDFSLSPSLSLSLSPGAGGERERDSVGIGNGGVEDVFSLSTGELFGGARIAHIFHQIFIPTLSSLSPLSGLTPTIIRTALHNARGPQAALWVPERAFHGLIRRQIQKLEEPCMHCCDRVYEELIRLCDRVCSRPELERFPPLQEKVRSLMVDLIRKALRPLKEFVRQLILIEQAYINTSHPDFNAREMLQTVDGGSMREREREREKEKERLEEEDRLMKRRRLSGEVEEELKLGDVKLEHKEKISPKQVGSSSVSSNVIHPISTSSSLLSRLFGTGITASTPTSHSTKPKSGNNSHTTSTEINTRNGQVDTQGHRSSDYYSYASGVNNTWSDRGDSQAGKSGNNTEGRSRNGSGGLLGFTAGGMEGLLLPRDGPSTSSAAPTTAPTTSSSHSPSLSLPTSESTTGTLRHVPPVLRSNGPLSATEEREIEILATMLHSYFSLVVRRIEDSVPKAIMHFLVNHTSTQLNAVLVAALYNQDLFEELLVEGEIIAQHRKVGEHTLNVLKKAMEIVNEVTESE